MALEQDTKDFLWFGGYPVFFILLLFAGALWISTVNSRVTEHFSHVDSILESREEIKNIDFEWIKDSTKRYKVAEQYYWVVFWNSLDSTQKVYLEKIRRYQDSLSLTGNTK